MYRILSSALALILAIGTAMAQEPADNLISVNEYKALKERADEGNAYAIYALGEHFYNCRVPGVSREESLKAAASYWALGRQKRNVPSITRLGQCYRNGIGVAVDTLRARGLFVEAIEYGDEHLRDSIETSARNGSTFDALVLYQCASEGKGMPKNERVATEYLTIAADNGDSKSSQALANILYSNSDFAGALARYRAVAHPSPGVRLRIAELSLPDNPASLDTIVMLAGDGLVQATEMLGRIYYDGIGAVPVDMSKAAEWNRKAAAAGSHKAAMLLASQLIGGRGVTPDYDQAIYFLETAVPAGYTRELRDSLSNAWAPLPFIHYINGVSYAQAGNTAAALSAFKQAKKLKVKGADSRIAMLLVPMGSPDKAVKELAKLAKKGDVTAYVPLGRLYLTGIGTDKNTEEALRYAIMAANAGLPEGMCLAGDIYFDRGDYAEAVRSYDRAQAAGVIVPESRANYVRCLRNGLGTEVNLSHAKAVEKAVPADRLIDLFRIVIQEAERK